MRKAAKALNHAGVPLGPGKGLDKTGLLGERPEQPHGFLLAREVLAVHERHVQEPALERLQLTIEAARNRIPRASAPRGIVHHSPSPPATAMSIVSRKRLRISASKAGSLRNHSARPQMDTSASATAGPNQNSSTASGDTTAIAL